MQKGNFSQINWYGSHKGERYSVCQTLESQLNLQSLSYFSSFSFSLIFQHTVNSCLADTLLLRTPCFYENPVITNTLLLRTPAIMDKRWNIQRFDWKWLPLLQTLTITDFKLQYIPRVSTITRVDCTCNRFLLISKIDTCFVYSFLFFGQSVIDLCPFMGFLHAEQTGRALVVCPLLSISAWTGTANKQIIFFLMSFVKSDDDAIQMYIENQEDLEVKIGHTWCCGRYILCNHAQPLCPLSNGLLSGLLV